VRKQKLRQAAFRARAGGIQGTLWFQELPGLGLRPGPARHQSLNCEQHGGGARPSPLGSRFPATRLSRELQTDTYNVSVYLSTGVPGTGNHQKAGRGVHQLLNKHLFSKCRPLLGRLQSGHPFTVYRGGARLSCWVLMSGRKPSLRPALTGEGHRRVAVSP